MIIVKTKEEWEAEGRTVSTRGTLYVYTDNDGSTTNAQIKIGDGMAYIIDLPFFLGDAAAKLEEHIADYRVHITEAERAFWNSKVTAYIEDNNVLVLDNGAL